jgi:hypothetical protein
LAASILETLEQLERGGPMDAATATDLLERTPAGRLRSEVLHRLAHHWVRRDPEAALAWAEQLSGPGQWEALEVMLHGWAEADPAAAAAYAAAMPGSEHSLRMVRDMARRWAERDRASAVEWALALDNPAARERALAGVVEYWGQQAPAEAATFAAELGDVSDRREVLNAAARQWAGTNTGEALAWAQNLPPGDREQATRAILRHVAERDPTRAAALYEELAGREAGAAGDLKPHELQRMAREIAWVWSSSDPAAAATWATQLPEAADVRRAAVGEVAEHWLRLDSMAAGEWIGRLPVGPTRDSATERLVRDVVDTDPAVAFEWAGTVSNDGHRFGMMRDVLGRWRTTDPAAAQAAYQSANLPPDQLRHLGEVLGFLP